MTSAIYSFTFLDRYAQNPFENRKNTGQFLKNILSNTGYTIGRGILEYGVAEVSETFFAGTHVKKEWAINLFIKCATAGATAEAIGPIAYQLIKTANQALNAGSRFLGLKTRIEIPNECISMLTATVASMKVSETLGYEKASTTSFAASLIDSIILPDLLKHLYSRNTIVPLK